jgi:hypothetical protein
MNPATAVFYDYSKERILGIPLALYIDTNTLLETRPYLGRRDSALVR